MVILVIGGSGSGKSAYAEQLISEMADVCCKYYLATMKVYDDEGERKVERHRRLRQGKGFLTVEQPVDIGGAAERIQEGSAVLVECISNLAANEMFGESTRGAEEVAGKIVGGIRCLSKKAKCLVIVTNNVFEDGTQYDDGTREYLKSLAKINRMLVEIADEAVEVVVGIPLAVKGEKDVR